MEFIHYPVKDDSTYVKEYILGDLAQTHLNIPYDSVSEAQKFDIYLPNNAKKPFPLLIYIHGGGLIRGDKTRHIDPLLQGLRYGYALACVNYRLAEEAPFPAMIDDVFDCIKYLKAHSDEYGIDKDRFIVWGETHGSYLACLTGMYGRTIAFGGPEYKYKDYEAGVAGVIDYWAFTDFLTTYEESLEKKKRDPEAIVIEELIFHKQGEELIEEIRKYPKPLDGINEETPPFYILHGELDNEIPRKHSIAYYETLKKAGKEVYFELVSKTKHSLPMYQYAWQIEGTYRFIHKLFDSDRSEEDI